MWQTFRLSGYLSRLVLTNILAALLVLVILGLSIDLIKTASDLIQEGGIAALGGYAALKAPIIATTIFPIGILIGSTVAFLTLGARSELVVIRGAGRSMLSILLMLLPTTLILGGAYHLLSDRMTTWADTALSETYPVTLDTPDMGAEIWSRTSTVEGDRILRAELSNGTGTKIEAVEIWELDGDGRVTEKRLADQATFDGKAWTLEGIEGTDGAPQPWPTALTPETVRALAAGRLPASAAEARAALAGSTVQTRSEAYYVTRIFQSYAAILVPAVMVTLASLAGFGLNRGGGGLKTALIGIVLGLLYVTGHGVLGSLSEVGAVDPVWAATLPTALFAVIGIWGLVLLEE